MTSSLVGSEMCIRDSNFLHTQRGRTLPGVEGMRFAERKVASRGECCRDCLLYTSDAADDM
eukprot:10909059-Prorocentrum_lima.AAC.1